MSWALNVEVGVDRVNPNLAENNVGVRQQLVFSCRCISLLKKNYSIEVHFLIQLSAKSRSGFH